MWRKIFSVVLKVLQVLLLLVVAFGASVFASNQVIAAYRAAQQAHAEEACMMYEIPHAVIVDGEVWCYQTYMGTERIVPLRELYRIFSGTSG